jgi:hypothetical protein
MNKAISRAIRSINPAFPVPYVAMLIGLVFWKSGWAAIILYHAGIGITLYLRRSKITALDFVPRDPLFTNISCLVLGFTGFIIWLFWPIAGIPGILVQSTLIAFGLSGSSIIAFAIYYSTVNPVLEELFWREIKTDSKVRYVNDIFYAGYHFMILCYVFKPLFAALAILVLVGAGMFWRYKINKGKSYLYAILTHAAADLSIVIAAIVLR